jgi:Tol biopolymer transport system component
MDSVVGSRLRVAVICALVLLAVLALAACGGSDTATSDSPSGAPSQAAASPSVSPTPVAEELPVATVAGTIAFVKMVEAAEGYNSEIFTVRTDGTGLKQLTDDPVWEETPSWSPDGRRIAYVVLVLHTDASDIWAMNADGSGRKNLTKGAPHGGRPVWSPDGKQIASATRDASGDLAINLVNADGSGVRPLGGDLSSLDLPADWAENGGGLEWAPDGRILLWSAPDEYGEVFAVEQDGSGLTQLTQGAQLGTFAMSPDGTKLALHDQAKRLYVAPVEDDAEGEVTLMDETYGYVFDPWARVSWSPDGEAMAFATDSMLLILGSPLLVINADGTGLSRVPGCPSVFDPAWRPE